MVVNNDTGYYYGFREPSDNEFDSSVACGGWLEFSVEVSNSYWEESIVEPCIYDRARYQLNDDAADDVDWSRTKRGFTSYDSSRPSAFIAGLGVVKSFEEGLTDLLKEYGFEEI